ncbi:hydrolase 1, exosortase A system-associated [Sphingomonas sp.]|uniref:hydrolase 1, exosortase A system-associated n=1 Tax=Sphingomonas sp. TaxID=28214 RepID=UPI003B00FA38
MTPPPRALRLAGGSPIWHYGPGADSPQLLVLQPLFEEMNRTRALVAALCRGLAARGVGCWLPDLPGTGEDRRDLRDVTWADWCDAILQAGGLIAETTGVQAWSLAIRGGALLDAAATEQWRLAPASGASLLRDLQRAGLTGEAMAGYDVPDSLRHGLAAATCEVGPAVRTLRLTGDERPADARVDGPALWRRSEPASDGSLATALVEDVLAWLPSDRAGEDGLAGADAEHGPHHDDGRTLTTIPLDGGWIAATIDGPARATHGWLFVTGGSQTRVGPNRLYEHLAAVLAARGESVIRFDRRGTGDSPGEDRGFEESAPEIAAAAAALRAYSPRLAHLSGFGLCDGATALALHGQAAGIDRIVAANPWVVEATTDAPAAAAVRAHYRERLLDPSAWARLLKGGVDLRRLARSLGGAARRDDTSLAAAFARGVPAGSTLVLAGGDNTARAFADAWGRLPATPAVETITVATRSHSFAGADARDALAAALTRQR